MSPRKQRRVTAPYRGEVIYVRCDGALMAAIDAEAKREARKRGDETCSRAVMVRLLLKEALREREQAG